MKQLHRVLLAITAGLCLTTQVRAQITAFSYSGQLDDNGAPANGRYVFRFTLIDGANGGAVVAGPIQPPVTGVTNGAFSFSLDFGNVFDGSDRWLGIEVHTNDNLATFTSLNPRVQILPTPYAITAGRLSGTIATANLADAAVTATKLSATGPASGQILTYDGSALAWTVMPTDLLWSVTGNAGSIAGMNFLGTTDNQPLEFRVNNTPALRLVPEPNGPTVIGGAANNSVAAGVYSATIAGGSENTIQSSSHHSTIGGGQFNTIPNAVFWSTISGGGNNTNGGAGAVIGGGILNNIGGGGLFATVPGGYQNTANGSYSVILGGLSNVVTRSGGVISGGTNNLIDAVLGVIAGGGQNTIQDSAKFSVIAGGESNRISQFSAYSTIGGGVGNLNNGGYSVIGGGKLNTVGSGSLYATIPGGWWNTANGSGSLAAGKQAKALHDDAFVWSDGNSGSDFASTANNQFLISAGGGVGINTNNPHGVALNVSGDVVATRFVGDGTQLTGVGGGTVADGSITTAKLADSAVTTIKMNNLAVTTAKMADNAITTPKLLDGAVTAVKLSASSPVSGQVLGYNGSALAWTTPAGGGGDLWKTNGNTIVSGSFLGTLNNFPLELRVNNVTALRITPGTGGNNLTPNIIGGAANNSVAAGVSGAVIGGGEVNIIASGATDAAISGGQGNMIGNGATTATIGGGIQNRISDSVGNATVGGGSANKILQASVGSTIAGGAGNIITNSQNATISGGTANVIEVQANAATIGGGSANYVRVGGAVIAGGRFNMVSDFALDSAIGGGNGNLIQAAASGGTVNAAGSTISGGSGNVILSTGTFGMIPGGSGNQVGGARSFAAGNSAHADHGGTFVWNGGGTGGSFASSDDYQFLVHAVNGVGINTNNPHGMALNVNGTVVATHFVGDGTGLTGVGGGGGVPDGSITAPKFAATLPASGQVLSYNGSDLAWITPSGGGGWLLSGNTIGGGDFLGSINNATVALRANNLPALRIVPGGAAGTSTPNLIGGDANNSIAADVFAAVIGGGSLNTNLSVNGVIAGGALNAIGQNSSSASVLGGFGNRIFGGSAFSVIGGGQQNLIRDNTQHSFLGGGQGNSISTNSGHSAIVGGNGNQISEAARQSFIGGGKQNLIESADALGVGGSSSVIGGGLENKIRNGAYFSHVGGGHQNEIGTNSYNSIIGGGESNKIWRQVVSSVIAGGGLNEIELSATAAVIGGGSGNTIRASAYFAHIGGGLQNEIGTNSSNATIVSGYHNYVKGANTTIAGGNYNQAIGEDATVAGGALNVAAGVGSVVLGGEQNYAAHDRSAVVGQGATSRATNSLTIGAMIETPGDAQAGHYVLRGQAGGEVASFILGPEVPVSGAIAFSALITAKQFGNASAAFEIKGVIRNYGGVVDFVPGGSLNNLGNEIDFIEPLFPVSPTNVGSRLAFRVVALRGGTVRWVISLHTAEVVY